MQVSVLRCKFCSGAISSPGRTSYCGAICAHKAYLQGIKKSQKKRDNKKYDAEKLAFKCQNCGGHWPKESPLHGAKFCSKACARAADRKRKKERRKNDPRWAEAQRARLRAHWHKRKESDPEYHKALIAKRKSRITWRLAKRMRARLHEILRGRRISASTAELLGCSVEQLRQHLQSQFKRGMHWNNWGSVWHIDHIHPLASFDLSDQKQRAIACHFTNLRPMFAAENQAKSDKITVPQLPLPI